MPQDYKYTSYQESDFNPPPQQRVPRFFKQSNPFHLPPGERSSMSLASCNQDGYEAEYVREGKYKEFGNDGHRDNRQRRRSRCRSESNTTYSSADEVFHGRREGSRYRSSKKGDESVPSWRQAATAAAAAGLIEAARSRHDPEIATRVAIAAASSAVVDVIIGKRNDHKGVRHVVESTIAGLLIQRVANGRPMKQSP